MMSLLSLDLQASAGSEIKSLLLRPVVSSVDSLLLLSLLGSHLHKCVPPVPFYSPLKHGKTGEENTASQ